MARKKMLRQPVGILNLTTRARNCFTVAGIVSMGDLMGKTEAQLLFIKNFGRTTLNKVKEELSRFGLRLKKPLRDWHGNVACPRCGGWTGVALCEFREKLTELYVCPSGCKMMVTLVDEDTGVPQGKVERPFAFVINEEWPITLRFEYVGGNR